MSKKKTAEKKTTNSKANEPKDVNTLVYCGPSIKNTNLQQYAIYQGDLPENIKGFIKKHPIIRELLVDPKNLAVTRKNLIKVGTKENQVFKKISEIMKGGK